MRKFLLIICLLSIASFSFAKDRLLENNMVEPVFGTVESIGLNSIDVMDEHNKRVKRFVYLHRQKNFQKGDRVRIDPASHRHDLAATVTKMTNVEYKKEGRNAGYITK
jgi:hypothetical protein